MKTLVGSFLFFFLLSVSLVSAEIVEGGCFGYGGGYGMMSGYYGLGIFGILIQLLVLAVLVLLVVWLVKQIQKK